MFYNIFKTTINITRGDRGGGAQRPPQRDCLRHGRGRGGGTPALGDRGQHLIATAYTD